MELRVAAYAVVADERGLLLAHWRSGSRSGWTMPGGGIDLGEDPADAVVREVAEETGFDIVVEELLGIDSMVTAAADRLPPTRDDVHGLRIVYRGRVIGGDLRDEVGGSTDRAAWFTLAEVAALDRVSLVDIALGLAGFR